MAATCRLEASQRVLNRREIAIPMRRRVADLIRVGQAPQTRVVDRSKPLESARYGKAVTHMGVEEVEQTRVTEEEPANN